MKIGELARLTDCEVQTIRFYEREGLLPIPERTSSGYRVYQTQHVVALNFIRLCRALGIGLADIRRLRDLQANPDLACDEINQLIDQQIQRIHQQVESLQVLESQLRQLRQACHHNQKASECGIIRHLQHAAVVDCLSALKSGEEVKANGTGDVFS
ncbi:Cd(II)/Pb(II)-responsive transcriptional regulator [Aquaspirillum serpens]|uniref:Cd(II)/Pb(II)-responsive transcriptional regulator n=1 Tax=Aquaspirillum serpens TaxID=190 RepID=UPI0003B38D31|nr:Cd(II)/Pb(II)-responsive transcriptional regulator [Aquaspirillum serpens]